MKTILLILVVAFGTISGGAAEKAKHADPLTGHPVRSCKGKVVDFTKGIASVVRYVSARSAYSTNPQVMAENRKRIQAAEREVKPWLNMLVDGRALEAKDGLVIVRTFNTEQLVAVTNSPSSFPVPGDYVTLAFQAGRVRYGGKSIPLFDYGQPVTP